MRTTTVDDITILEDGDGYIEMNQPAFEASSGELDVILVPTKYRNAVALALLGGITDELVGKITKVLHEDLWDEPWRGDCDGCKPLARSVLTAIFGDPTP